MADFSQALQWMKEGKRVRRIGWVGSDDYIRLSEGIVFFKELNTLCELSMGNILADDWEIYIDETEAALIEFAERLSSDFITTGNYSGRYTKERISAILKEMGVGRD